MSKIWLELAASGLGRNIAEGLLASGDRLAATARDARRLEGLVLSTQGQIRAPFVLIFLKTYVLN